MLPTTVDRRFVARYVTQDQLYALQENRLGGSVICYSTILVMATIGVEEPSNLGLATQAPAAADSDIAAASC